jgi:hypothetical protein
VSAGCATVICAAIAVPGKIVKIYEVKAEAKFAPIGNEKDEAFFPNFWI